MLNETVRPLEDPVHLFATVRQPCEYRPNVTAIVLFGLRVEGAGEPPVYLDTAGCGGVRACRLRYLAK